MKSICVKFFALLIVMTGCEDRAEFEGPEPSIISISTDDSEMEAAMVSARETFPNFWSEVSADFQRVIPVLTLVQVKAYFCDEGDPDGGEHLWVGGLSFDGKKISGTLMSQPGHLEQVSAGESVEFSVDQLSDWLLVRDGRATGVYTVQVLRARMTDEDRASHDAHYSFEFPALGKQ